MIISIGLYFFTQANSTADVASTLSSLEIQTHNSRYEMLRGIQSGTNVRIVLNYAVQDNESLGESAKDADTINLCVNVRSNDSDILKKFKNNSAMYSALTTRNYGVRFVENIKQIANVVQTNRNYYVWYSYTTSGYIWEVHIDSPN